MLGRVPGCEPVGAPPQRAYVVSIPATNLEMGLELTAASQAAASEAVGRIVGLLAERVP